MHRINRIKSETNNFKYHCYFLDQRTGESSDCNKTFCVSIINTSIQLIRFRLYLGLRKRNNWKIDNIEPVYFYIEAAPMTNIVLHYRIVNTIRSNRLQTLRVINDCVTWFVGLHINICICMICCLVRKNKQRAVLVRTRGPKSRRKWFRGNSVLKTESTLLLELVDLHRPPYLSFDNFRAAADAHLVLFRVANGRIRTSTTKNEATNLKWETTPIPGTYYRNYTIPLFRYPLSS